MMNFLAKIAKKSQMGRNKVLLGFKAPQPAICVGGK
jgi:hypothetical protein